MSRRRPYILRDLLSPSLPEPLQALGRELRSRVARQTESLKRNRAELREAEQRAHRYRVEAGEARTVIAVRVALRPLCLPDAIEDDLVGRVLADFHAAIGWMTPERFNVSRSIAKAKLAVLGDEAPPDDPNESDEDDEPDELIH